MDGRSPTETDSANTRHHIAERRRLRWAASLYGLAAVALIVWSGCRSAPVTGRRQLLVIPEKQEISMGVKAYREILAKEKPSTDQRLSEMVERVGRRIAAVAGKPDYGWEFHVIASSQQNAFALPGGKVAVYAGILSICKNEAGLAVVMSHEIAHALARHGGERMSQQMAADGLGKVVQVVSRQRAPEYEKTILAVYGAGSKYGVLLPYSRKHESEADHIGLMLMAKAGYDPREAPRFWQRFAASTNGKKPPEFLSTHPSDETRAENLRKLLPGAMQLYEQAPVKAGLGGRIPAAGRRSR
ncbi:MAG: M48 family metallopeptidase [Planctomycetaceae bacterium]